MFIDKYQDGGLEWREKDFLQFLQSNHRRNKYNSDMIKAELNGRLMPDLTSKNRWVMKAQVCIIMRHPL
jgi:hypothetical protein